VIATWLSYRVEGKARKGWEHFHKCASLSEARTWADTAACHYRKVRILRVETQVYLVEQTKL
jgi:hypothetical protein